MYIVGIANVNGEVVKAKKTNDKNKIEKFIDSTLTKNTWHNKVEMLVDSIAFKKNLQFFIETECKYKGYIAFIQNR